MEFPKQLLRRKQSHRIQGKRTVPICHPQWIQQAGYGDGHGVVNLINTTLSNQMSRKRENSILRSVGLTGKHGLLTQRQLHSGPDIHLSEVLLIACG